MCGEKLFLLSLFEVTAASEGSARSFSCGDEDRVLGGLRGHERRVLGRDLGRVLREAAEEVVHPVPGHDVELKTVS